MEPLGLEQVLGLAGKVAGVPLAEPCVHTRYHIEWYLDVASQRKPCRAPHAW